ncbi:MAG TPA: ABC transporter permease subunit [Anaerolineales bacterium]|nr:ABC transporter permease subunit [Anaerolineales bacterium]
MSASAASRLQLVNEKGWRRGLGNLLRGEYSSWFKSSRWWKHILMWFAIINGMMMIMVLASADAAEKGFGGPPVLFMYGIFGGMFVAIGVMIIMQRVLVKEKQSGTAAWALSKPVTRAAFVVSRLVVNSIAILITSVIVPGIVFHLTLGFFSEIGWLSPIGFAAALLMVALHTFYWIAFVLMMGALLESTGSVIGVSMTLFFTFWYGPALIPDLIYISPLLLIFSPAPDQFNSLPGSFMTGEPVFSWWPLISTVISCIAFIAVAIRRFNRQEF